MPAKKIFLFFIAGFYSLFLHCQNSVSEGEYFWDTDPGQGNATILLAADGNFDEALEAVFQNSLTLPALGLHTFNVRVKDIDGLWGPIFSTVINIESELPFSIINLIQAEFFWDIDPGQGNGISLLALDGNFDNAMESVLQNNVTLPSLGLHSFNVRVKDVNANWGSVFSTVISIESEPANSNISLVQAEFFWDADPGQGNGNALLAFDGNFDNAIERVLQNNLTLPTLGLHSFNVRVKGVTGNWGPVFSTSISIENEPALTTINLIQAEYFWDTDPGQGNANTILALDGNFDNAIEELLKNDISTFSLSLGAHAFFIRVRDVSGIWGPAFGTAVYVDPSVVPVIAGINGPASFCEPDIINPMNYSVTNVAGDTYNWSISGGTILSGINTSDISVQWNPSGPYSIILEQCNIFGCGQKDTLFVQANAVPTTPNVSSNSPVCEGESIIFLTETIPGATYNWTGPVGFISAIQNPSILNATISNAGIYLVTATVNGCTSNAATNNVSVNSLLPVTINIVASNTSICEGDNITFTSGIINGGTSPFYQWLINGIDVGTNNSSFSNTTFSNGDIVSCILTSNAAPCATTNPALSNTVTITVSSPPTIADAGIDQVICSSTTILSGNIPTSGTGNWSVISGAATIISPSSPNSSLTSIATGNNILRWTVSNGSCADSFNDVIITSNQSSGSTINEVACDNFELNSQLYNSSGTYIQTLTNVFGCDSIITLNLTINSADISVSQNGTILTANAIGATYQWVDCNSGFSPIAGETNQIYSASANGDYAVIVTENSCSDTSACLQVQNSGMENIQSYAIIIYPNPTLGNFTIDLGQIYTDVKIVITTISGQIVSSESYENVKLISDELEVATGIYFVTLEINGEKSIHKLIVE